jgi:hypothetical protein
MLRLIPSLLLGCIRPSRLLLCLLCLLLLCIHALCLPRLLLPSLLLLLLLLLFSSGSLGIPSRGRLFLQVFIPLGPFRLLLLARRLLLLREVAALLLRLLRVVTLHVGSLQRARKIVRQG